MKAVIIILLIGLLGMIVFPFVGIWSLNTLFGLNIVYGWKTWLAWMGLFITLNLSLSVRHRRNK
jgi:hypothetical protein